MSSNSKNKRVAALLTGASLLTIVAGARASAANLTIAGAHTGSVFITSPFDRVIITSTANVSGDVVNQSVIGNGNDANPVAIQSGAVITGAFINKGQFRQQHAAVVPSINIAAAAAIIDTAPGVERINNTSSGVIPANATAGNALIALAGAGGVVQAEALANSVADTVTNAGSILAHASAHNALIAAAGGVGVLQAQLLVGSGSQDINNSGTIEGAGVANVLSWQQQRVWGPCRRLLLLVPPSKRLRTVHLLTSGAPRRRPVWWRLLLVLALVK